jgi:hypothetical protein
MMDWSCMCKKNREIIDHLMLRCEMAREMWVSVFHPFGLEWIMPY